MAENKQTDENQYLELWNEDKGGLEFGWKCNGEIIYTPLKEVLESEEDGSIHYPIQIQAPPLSRFTNGGRSRVSSFITPEIKLVSIRLNLGPPSIVLKKLEKDIEAWGIRMDREKKIREMENQANNSQIF